MKKKILSTITVFIMLLSVVGCGNNASSNTKEEALQSVSISVSVEEKVILGTFQKQALDIKSMTLEVFQQF
jgi:ABC-type Zn uptake system ZnuABC Zn-binding protein ZnuA